MKKARKPQLLSQAFAENPHLLDELRADGGYETRAQSRKQAAHNTAAPETDAAESAPKLQDLAQEQYRVREVLIHHARTIRQYGMRNDEFKDEVREQLADDAKAAEAGTKELKQFLTELKQRVALLEHLNAKLAQGMIVHEAKQHEIMLRKLGDAFDAKLDRYWRQLGNEQAARGRLQDRYERHFGQE